MTIRSWEEFAACEDLIGRDIQISEPVGPTWRGPIKTITLDEKGNVEIILTWGADYHREDGGRWEFVPPDAFIFGTPYSLGVASTYGSVHEAADGQIHLSAPLSWSAVINSTTDEALQPAEVLNFDYAVL